MMIGRHRPTKKLSRYFYFIDLIFFLYIYIKNGQMEEAKVPPQKLHLKEHGIYYFAQLLKFYLGNPQEFLTTENPT